MSIKLYTAATPNGQKVSIFLELLGLDYTLQHLDLLGKRESKQEWFLKLNPNGRIPTLTDSSTNITISESAAILQYLVDTYDKDHKFSYEIGTPLYYKQLELLYFQMSAVGPMQGQLEFFHRFAPEKVPYAIERYSNETKRLYGVLQLHLERNAENGLFLVGNHLSIADIVTFTWANKLSFDLADWPLVKQWKESIASLPEVQKGLKRPESTFK